MRKGFLTVLLALAMAFGFAMNAAAIDNLAEPSVGFVVPWVEGDTTGGLDTVVGVYQTPAATASSTTIVWTFFGAALSNHILDNDFPITPGMAYLYSWNIAKHNVNLDGVPGYLVFADPALATTTLTANALQVLGFEAAAYVPVLQLRGGYFADGAVLHSLDGWAAADQDLSNVAWTAYSNANNGNADAFATKSGSVYAVNAKTGAEIQSIGGDLQIVSSPNTAYNGIQLGQTVIPRFAGGPTENLYSFIGIWKPDTNTVGAGAVNFWDTSTEDNTSLQFSSSHELVILDPYDDAVLGNPNYSEGAVEFRGWPSDGGIVFTLVSAFPNGATIATEIQTLIAPHYTEAAPAL